MREKKKKSMCEIKVSCVNLRLNTDLSTLGKVYNRSSHTNQVYNTIQGGVVK